MDSSVMKNSSLKRPLSNSPKLILNGGCGWILAVMVVTLDSKQIRRASAMDPGPLSDRMNARVG